MEDDAVKKMAEGLLIAIKAEQEGRHFYLMAARSTDDQQGRRVFEELAEEELIHFNFLNQQYQSVLETGAPDANIKLEARPEKPGSGPIFSSEIQKRVGEAHFEMTALSVGIQLELNAIKFYTRAAEETPDPGVKKFYRELAEWESGHYHALLSQQEALKEGYWAENTFSPY